MDGKHKQGQPKMKGQEQVEGNIRKDVADHCRKSCKSSKMHPVTSIYRKNLTGLKTRWLFVIVITQHKSNPVFFIIFIQNLIY